MFLEKQLHRVDGSVSASEEQLAADGPVSATPGALQERSKQLQVTSSYHQSITMSTVLPIYKNYKIITNNKSCDPHKWHPLFIFCL